MNVNMTFLKSLVFIYVIMFNIWVKMQNKKQNYFYVTVPTFEFTRTHKPIGAYLIT